MSLFGSLMGDFDEDMGFGNQMNAMNMQMRSMNRLMNTFMPDPFNMLAAPFDPGFQQNAMIEHGHHGMMMPPMGFFGFPAMPNMNRLLSADIGSTNGASYCTSSMISMSSGPDGRPQIYQATSSTKTGPGGIKETRRTVQDSTKGIKKMAIGHHIGERAHIIEKEQDVNSGQLEERQEFINLEEEEAEDFDREFTNKARMGRRQLRPQEILAIESADDGQHSRRRQHQQQQRRQLPALPAPPPSHPQENNRSMLSATLPQHPPNKNNNAMAPVMSATATPPALACAIRANNHNNNATPQQCAYVGGKQHHLAGATPRRPLRTPPPSAASTSVHPHPYNAAAARRNHRSKHSKQHQQQQQQQQPIPYVELIDDEPTVAVTPSANVAAAAPMQQRLDDNSIISK